MINGVIGKPGSGKTYHMTALALREADRDRLVFTNWPVAHPNVYFFTPEQLLDLPPGAIFIDEAHLWFPARQALKLPVSWLAGLSQTRKKGWDLWWSAQHESRCDRVIRDVTNWAYLARCYGTANSKPWLFIREQYEMDFFRVKGKCQGREFSRFSKRVADAYDTHGSVLQATHTIDAKDAYAKRGTS